MLAEYSQKIKEHATAALITIVVLVVLLIYLMVMYKGLLGFGPYVKEKTPDKEIENLVSEINKAFKS